MDLELEGKTAIVTGGSAGIGRAVALELVREGVDVAICARRPEPLEETAAELAQETGRRIVAVPADTTDHASVEHMVEVAYGVLGRVDILVNDAAFPGDLVTWPLAEASEEALMADVNTKVIGYFRCPKAVEPHMRRQGWDRIINIGGTSARQGGTISGLRNAVIVHLTKTPLPAPRPRRCHGQLDPPGHDAHRTQRSRLRRAGPATGSDGGRGRGASRWNHCHPPHRRRPGHRVPGLLPRLAQVHLRYRRGRGGRRGSMNAVYQ